jgi:hypothetical protein
MMLVAKQTPAVRNGATYQRLHGTSSTMPSQLLPNFYPKRFLHLIVAKIPMMSPLEDNIPFKEAGY